MAAHHPVRPLEEILAEVVYEQDAMEVLFTEQRRVACQGPGGALGHPRVFYTIGDKGYAECGYCDRVFVYDPSRSGTVLEGGYEDQRNREPSLPNDGLTASATPLPGETLALDGDTGSSSDKR
ncbi:zinc-finger domain-containing protein [Parvularcula sp. LCG005]|uniref:zinc-finger domain-containing protein n=1 Tax=Parvularcula sp. LCG005 TaxID=3078805 RepID=UPI002941C848|nr:zinc-finger domain-containing protein [Parvularcula sp. LCG005]WOI53242.1 zinc-finger domain-containing protein [Parvularcula sp. LCG005]